MPRTEGHVTEDRRKQTRGEWVPPTRYPLNHILLYDHVTDRYIMARCDVNGALEVTAVIPLGVDVTDRWARELGQVDLARYLGVACGLANPVHTQTVVGGAVIDPRDRNWVLTALTDGVTVTPVAGGLWDVSDRAARLLGIVYGETAQLQQLTPADAVTPANSLEVAGFPHVYDPVGGDWNRQREGAAIGQALVDPADRWARQLGLVDLSRVLGAALTAANPVIAGIYDAAANRMPSMDACARAGYVQICYGGAVIDPRAIRALTAADVVTAQQTTRTNMTVQAEREDLSLHSETINEAGAADVEIIAAVAGQQHKIFDVSYYIDSAVRVGFRFGVGNRFCVKNTTGVFAQTFTHPHVGAANTALNFRVEAAVTGEVSVHYVTE